MRQYRMVDGQVVKLCGAGLHPMVGGNVVRKTLTGNECKACRTKRQRGYRQKKAAARQKPAVTIRKCADPECGRSTLHGARGWCGMHYARVKRAEKSGAPPPPPIVWTPLPALTGAACRDVGLPLWDAEVDGENLLERNLRWERATELCWSCPVKAACKAARREQDAGVWGGCLFMASS